MTQCMYVCVNYKFKTMFVDQCCGFQDFKLNVTLFYRNVKCIYYTVKVLQFQDFKLNVTLFYRNIKSVFYTVKVFQFKAQLD